MEKKIELNGFKQFDENKDDLLVDDYKGKFLWLHKYVLR